MNQMKYYIITTKPINYTDRYGNGYGCTLSKILCIVENEEVAKDFCNKNPEYTYKEETYMTSTKEVNKSEQYMDLEKAYNKIDNFCCSNHNTLQGNKVRYLNDREETIDMFRDYQETKDDDFCKDANEMVESLESIKKLVDLQKDIDCPLDVRERALKSFYWEYLENDENIKNYYVYAFNNEFLYVCYTCDEDGTLTTKQTIFPLQYYKKYWWLKKDKSE